LHILVLFKAVQRNANQHGVSLNISTLSTANNFRCQASLASILHLRQPFKDGHTLGSKVGKFPICAGPSLTFKFPVHSACPCDKDGQYLPLGTWSHSQPQQPLDATPENPFHPFKDRLAFEFADFHFSKQQSSAAAIGCALQLWEAQLAKNGFDDVPWQLTNDMYTTIDEV
jgi:hypothetical protein